MQTLCFTYYPTSQQSFNRYAYCMYNPLKYVDPSGEQYFGYDNGAQYRMMESDLDTVQITQPIPVYIIYNSSLYKVGDSTLTR